MILNRPQKQIFLQQIINKNGKFITNNEMIYIHVRSLTLANRIGIYLNEWCRLIVVSVIFVNSKCTIAVCIGIYVVQNGHFYRWLITVSNCLQTIVGFIVINRWRSNQLEGGSCRVTFRYNQ